MCAGRIVTICENFLVFVLNVFSVVVVVVVVTRFACGG